MVSRIAMVGLAAALAVAPPAFAAGKPRNVSWGQPGISFAQYNRDAQQCAAQTFGVTLHLTPQTSRDLSIIANGSLIGLSTYRDLGISPELALSPGNVRIQSSTYFETYKHATRVDFTDQLQAILDACLVQRGYQRFRLTDAQMDRLRNLDQGSAERERYLFGLGTDPDVLMRQAI